VASSEAPETEINRALALPSHKAHDFHKSICHRIDRRLDAGSIEPLLWIVSFIDMDELAHSYGPNIFGIAACGPAS
jgi:hypothetical protein